MHGEMASLLKRQGMFKKKTGREAQRDLGLSMTWYETSSSPAGCAVQIPGGVEPQCLCWLPS